MDCRLKSKTMETSEWKEKHALHNNGLLFKTEPFGHPHEAWVWLCCPCGAKHLTDDSNGLLERHSNVLDAP